MKNVLAGTLVVGLLVLCGTATAYEPKVWDDLSWWGQSGATPAPVKDPVRSGYWWWPTEPASNAGDAELWGNRGVVYHIYEPAPKVETPPPPPPAPQEPPAKTWSKPVLNSVLFDFDKAVLKPEGQAVADEVVAHMREWEKTTVTIEGHTCDIGTDAYNQGLGQRRADAVQKYLIDSGINAGRVGTVSHGESRPAVPNDSAANRKLNRRAVFDIVLAE